MERYNDEYSQKFYSRIWKILKLNYSPKYGGRPEFTPSFVETVVHTVSGSGGTMDVSLLAEYIWFEDKEELKKMIKFGVQFGFWVFADDCTVVVNNAQNFVELSLNPLRFASYVHDSLYSLQLSEPKNWNSLAVLLAWAYSLKMTQSDSQRSKKVTLIPWSYNQFEEFGIQTKLCAAMDSESAVNSNDVQWTITRKWLQCIGLFMYTKDSLTPYPHILAHQIKTHLSGKSELVTPIRELVESFRISCPFLPGGVYGKMWTEHIKSQWGNELPAGVDYEEDFRLSEQESLVLTLLEAKKVISLKEQNDAGDSFSLTAGSVGRKVTHFQKIATHNG